MTKYLHKFENNEEFLNSYASTDGYEVTAITVNGTTYQYSGNNQSNGFFIWVNPENSADWVDSDVKRHPSAGDIAYITGDTQTTISEVFRIPMEEYYVEPWVSIVEGEDGIVYNDSFCVSDESGPCPSDESGPIVCDTICGMELL